LYFWLVPSHLIFLMPITEQKNCWLLACRVWTAYAPNDDLLKHAWRCFASRTNSYTPLIEVGFKVMYRIPSHAKDNGFSLFPLYGGTTMTLDGQTVIVIEYAQHTWHLSLPSTTLRTKSTNFDRWVSQFIQCVAGDRQCGSRKLCSWLPQSGLCWGTFSAIKWADTTQGGYDLSRFQWTLQ